ncbi:30S ribosomal protein S6 [Candidatus Curtissbacteria bacterium]|nr:30S ribosomal protein S6 [Candidatus Curtissbacteria bacterium]
MNYELMVVASVNQDSEMAVSRVEKMLKEAQASDLKLTKLGEKRLAFLIAKQDAGEYFVFNFQASGEAVGKISSALRLEREAILRYLIVKTKISKKVKKVTNESKESKVEEKTPKVSVKTKVLAKKSKKVVKSKKTAKGKKGK